MTIAASLSRPFLPTEDLSPESIEWFLRTSGWFQRQSEAGKFSIWENVEADASLMLPHNARFRDYSARLHDALETISEVHNIREDLLPIEIAGARSDVLFLRTEQYSMDASIPLAEAQVLLGGVHKMMLAAACSAIRPKASNPGRRPSAATSFVADDVRMGHTLRGSFVLTILARHDLARHNVARHDLPVTNTDETSSTSESVVETESGSSPSEVQSDIDREPYARQVMTTLADGLEASQYLLNDSVGITLDEAVQRGVSAELIDSIGSMSRPEGLQALDVAFKWSPAFESIRDTVDRIILSRPSEERVSTLTERLKQRPVVEQDHVIGQVFRLERAEGKDDGVVVVEGYLGRLRRRVHMRLSGQAYRVAIEAHDRQISVVATGNVGLRKRSWWLDGDVQIRPVLAGEE